MPPINHTNPLYKGKLVTYSTSVLIDDKMWPIIDENSHPAAQCPYDHGYGIHNKGMFVNYERIRQTQNCDHFCIFTRVKT